MQDQPKDQTLFDDLEIPLVKVETEESEYHHPHYSRSDSTLNPIQPPIISRNLPSLVSLQSYYPYENSYFPYHPLDIFEQGYKSEYDDLRNAHPDERNYYMPEMPLLNSSQSPICPLSPLSPQDDYYPDLPPAPGYVPPPIENLPPTKKGRRQSIQSAGGYSTDDTHQSIDSELKSKRIQVKKACAQCRKSCKKCSEHRPCDRCVNMGIECVDVPKPKPKKTVKRKNGNLLTHELEEDRIINNWISSSEKVERPSIKVDTSANALQRAEILRYESLSAGDEVLRSSFGDRFEYPTEYYPYSYGSAR